MEGLIPSECAEFGSADVVQANLVVWHEIQVQKGLGG
jgi:hypothetical protein